MGQYENISGRKFGMLTAIERGEDRIWKSNGKERKVVTWDCLCDCGNKKNVAYYDLVANKVKSCGCLLKITASKTGKSTIKHGFTSKDSPHWKYALYGIWSNIKQRCNNSKQQAYKYYGGRGITCADEWNDFKPFCDWALNNGYEEGLTIDRIDVNGNYEPNNCRWVGWDIQGNNRNNNVRIKINDEEHTASEWENITGTKAFNIGYRYNSGGHSEEEILSNEYLRDKRKRKIIYDGEAHSIREWAEIKGLTYSTINWRLNNGWSIEDALNIPGRKASCKVIEVDGETHTIEEWSRINKIGITTIYERISKGWSERDAVTKSPHSGMKYE